MGAEVAAAIAARDAEHAKERDELRVRLEAARELLRSCDIGTLLPEAVRVRVRTFLASTQPADSALVEPYDCGRCMDPARCARPERCADAGEGPGEDAQPDRPDPGSRDVWPPLTAREWMLAHDGQIAELSAKVTALEERLRKVEKQDHVYEFDASVGGCKHCGGPTNAIHATYPVTVPNVPAPPAPVAVQSFRYVEDPVISSNVKFGATVVQPETSGPVAVPDVACHDCHGPTEFIGKGLYQCLARPCRGRLTESNVEPETAAPVAVPEPFDMMAELKKRMKPETAGPGHAFVSCGMTPGGHVVSVSCPLYGRCHVQGCGTDPEDPIHAPKKKGSEP